MMRTVVASLESPEGYVVGDARVWLVGSRFEVTVECPCGITDADLTVDDVTDAVLDGVEAVQ